MLRNLILGYSDGRQIVDTLIAEISRRGKAGVVAVVDDHGELIAFGRMDNAPYSSITIAIHKAYTAARERKPSKDVGLAARDPKNGFDIGYFGDNRFTGWGGGVPIIRDGSVIGAVAVSGLPEAEDMELAQFAAGSLPVE